MADILITTDFSQLTNLNNALNQTAITVERKTNPALQRLQENLQFVKRVNEQVAQSNQMVGRSFSLNELNRASERLQNYEAALANTRQGMNSFGVVTQQAGYQIGDFLVQVQSGTNWMVAFGQQATQLVGILPMMGAGFMGLSTGGLVALSAGLGIAIPLITALGAAWMRTTEDVEAGASRQKEAYDSLIESLQSLRLERQMEQSGAQSQEEQIVFNEINDLLRERADLQNQILVATSEEMLIASQGRSSLMAAFLADEQEKKQARIDEINDLLEQLQYQRELDIAQRRRANEVRNEYRERERLKQVHADAVAALGEAQNEQRLMTVAAEQALSKYSMMRTVAAGLAANLAAAADATLLAVSRMNQLASMEYSGRGGDPKDFSEGGSKSYSKNFRPFVFTPPSAGSGGGSSAVAEQEDALQRLREQLALENELLGVSEAQQRVIRALGNDRANYTQAEIAAITAEIEAYNQKLEVMKQQQQIANVIQSSMEDAFMGIITGTESVKDAFKNMAYLIIQELYRVLVVQQLVGSFNATTGVGTGIVGGIMGGLSGGLAAGPSTGSFGLPFGGPHASGGSIMPNKAYLVGEHGPELVIPRHSGTVMNANQTASAMGGSGGVTVQNNISVTGSDAAMVRAEVAKMIPQITNATKAAVIDAKQRGGQMAAAFR